MGRRFVCALVTVVSVLSLGGGTVSAQEEPAAPSGTNDPSCKPSKGHTRPVVLVHGTASRRDVLFDPLVEQLTARGYCVWALNYGYGGNGFYGVADIRDSARELRQFIDGVLATTGARKVAVVGHSQGGMMPRWVIRFLGGKSRIAELVGFSPSNHGTETPVAPLLALTGGCDACSQQTAGSRFLRKLNRGDETPGKISYTVIQTRWDEIVTPYTSAFLDGRFKTTNVLLQEACPANTADHVFIPTDPVAIQWTLNALKRKGRPAKPRLRPEC